MSWSKVTGPPRWAVAAAMEATMAKQKLYSKGSILVSSFQKLSMKQQQHDCTPCIRLEESTEEGNGPLLSSPMGSSYIKNVGKGIEAGKS